MAGRQAVMREVVSSQVGGVGGGGHRTNGCSVRRCSRRGRAEAAGEARERERLAGDRVGVGVQSAPDMQAATSQLWMCTRKLMSGGGPSSSNEPQTLPQPCVSRVLNVHVMLFSSKLVEAV